MKVSKNTFYHARDRHGVVLVVDVDDTTCQALALAVDASVGVSYHVIDIKHTQPPPLRPATRLEILCHLRKAQAFIYRRTWDTTACHWDTDEDEIATYTAGWWGGATGYSAAHRVLCKEHGMDAEHDLEGGI